MSSDPNSFSPSSLSPSSLSRCPDFLIDRRTASHFTVALVFAMALLTSPRASAVDYSEVGSPAADAFRDHSDLLFYLDRDYNSNIVLYRANMDDETFRSPAVRSEWLMLNERGQKDTLNKSDKKVYDHRIQNGSTANEKKMVMTRVPDRPIKVTYDPKLKRPVAEININGKPARLVRIWVKLKYFIVPVGVEYFELIGFDEATGKIVREKVNP